MQAARPNPMRSSNVLLPFMLMGALVMATPGVDAAANPSAVYCSEMGYTLQGEECVFPDGSQCGQWAFYRGECGRQWSFCEKNGGRVDARTEEKGSWVGKTAVCMFFDGTECGEQALMKGECRRSECAKWTVSECADPIVEEEPPEPPEPDEGFDETAKEYAERRRAELGLGPAPEARHTSFGCSYFKRGNPPLSRQVLRPGDLLTIDLCPAEKMGCDWDDQAEVGNPFVLHQVKHKDLEQKKALLRFHAKERFQLQMDDPGNSLVTFHCRDDSGQSMKRFVTAVTVDPAATKVSFNEDGIQVMTSDGIKKFTPDSQDMGMGYMYKCKMLQNGKEPIRNIRSGLFDRFWYILCAADWIGCDWVDQAVVSDSGVVLQYQHKYVENPIFRKYPEEEFHFQTIGEGSSEITFTCMNEEGEEVRSETITLTVGQERWAEIIEYEKKEKEKEEEAVIEQPLCTVYDGSCPQACDHCCALDRLDYVYVKESGGGLTLTPVHAEVLRDWKYTDDACGDPIETDLSDHYPLLVKFAVTGPSVPDSKRELTFLNYNTHLFYGTKGAIAESQTGEVMIYQDRVRAGEIVRKLAESSADIIGLQEVWSPNLGMDFFGDALKPEYPYQYFVRKNPGLRNTSGTMLLSKLPIKNAQFREYPIHFPTAINLSGAGGFGLLLNSFLKLMTGGSDVPMVWDKRMPQDAMATKGIITADVELVPGGPDFRIGVTHALTNQTIGKGEWSRVWTPSSIATFEMNGEPYLFAAKNLPDGGSIPSEIIRSELKKKGDRVRIARIHDFSWDFDGVHYPDAGWDDIHYGRWTYAFIKMVSFRLNGHPYLFGVGTNDQAYIFRVNDDPSTGVTEIYRGKWSSCYVPTAITTFYLDRHPYIFALKKCNEGFLGIPGPATNKAYIRRINDDPSTGWTETGQGAWPSSDRAVVSFELNGHPYLFGATRDRRLYIKRINDAGNGWTDIFDGQPEQDLLAVSSFQLRGHPYIFLLKGKFVDMTKMPGGVLVDLFTPADLTRVPAGGEGRILKIADDPANGFETVYSKEHAPDYEAFVPFELHGHPWLFCAKHMIGEDAGHLPGEAYLRRIDDDGNGWQDHVNLPFVQIMIDETVRENRPAVIMGDLNVHLDHYGNMNRMFETFGMKDAYTKVHGPDVHGSETIDLCSNTLTQVFGQHSKSTMEGTENFDNVAAGLVCYGRVCEVCPVDDETDDVSVEDGRHGSPGKSKLSSTIRRIREKGDEQE